MRGGFRGGRGGMPGGMDPQAMARAMKQLGIQMEDIDDVEEVVIRTPSKDIVIRPASVSVMITKGERTWQVQGEPTERPRGELTEGDAVKAPLTPTITDGDVQLVMEQAGVSREEAVRALEEAEGEPAAAILALIEGRG